MAEGAIIGFRADTQFHLAVERAARVRGTTKSDLLKDWIAARLIAEGWMSVEGHAETPENRPVAGLLHSVGQDSLEADEASHARNAGQDGAFTEDDLQPMGDADP